MAGKVSKFINALKRDKGLIFEALFYLWISRIRVTLQPFKSIVPILGTPETETDSITREEDRQILYRISSSVITVAGHTPWQSKCLIQVMAAKRMLRRRGIPSTVYLGLCKNEGKEMIAHAWIRSGDVFLTSVKGKAKYAVVSIFGDLQEDRKPGKQRGSKL